ncbi:MAG: hypothetical protein ACSLEN_07045 [Candidatus Malihini olakiniferum]
MLIIKVEPMASKPRLRDLVENGPDGEYFDAASRNRKPLRQTQAQ